MMQLVNEDIYIIDVLAPTTKYSNCSIDFSSFSVLNL